MSIWQSFNDPASQHSRLLRFLRVRREEFSLFALAFGYFFLILCSYYVLRPVRDEIGVSGGVERLPWLFLGTLAVTVVVSPLFSSLVARMPRRRFVAWSYRGLSACLIAFFFLLHTPEGDTRMWLGRVFFVWLSVYNMFVVSLFWAVMADTFRTEQARRMYGLIGAGGTLGGLCGGVLTATLVPSTGALPLLLVSAALLEGALQCMFALGRVVENKGGAVAILQREVIGGSAFAGFTGVVKSPFLLGISGFMLLFTIGSTFLYFLQAQIVADAISDHAARTIYFAHVDMWVNALTLLAQFSLTSRIVSWIGVGGSLAVLPLISIIGFGWLGVAPILAAVVVFQVLRRTGDYALTRPAREVLYVPLTREEKFKAKNFIDTFVYRGGDQIGAWTHAGLLALGLGVGGIALAGVPFSVAWLALAWWLGRKYQGLQAAREGTVPQDSSPRSSAGVASTQRKIDGST